MYTWAGVPTYGERARVPIGRCVAYVYSSTRVVREVVYRYVRVHSSTRVVRAVVCKHHECTVVHTCSSRARAVVVIVALDF